jgi:hypothetical protein
MAYVCMPNANESNPIGVGDIAWEGRLKCWVRGPTGLIETADAAVEKVKEVEIKQSRRTIELRILRVRQYGSW